MRLRPGDAADVCVLVPLIREFYAEDRHAMTSRPSSVLSARPRQIINFGFPSLGAMKSWLATCVFALAVAQLISALAMFGRLPGVQRAPEWMPFVHRWSGTTAFVVSLRVAYHCLWSLGFQTVGTRQVVHATAGCLFYGAFATKLLALRIGRLPGWALPIIGGTIVAALTAIWLTSALWFFTKVGLPAYH